MSEHQPKPRLLSLDQFRGYTVAGMCVVNMLAPFAAIHSILKHNDTYFSYADSIMPGFLFIVGFAFRLTWLKRRREASLARTDWSYVRRSGRLLLLSLIIYAFVGDATRWFHFQDMPPEFQSFRALPPRTEAFDPLMRAIESEPQAAAHSAAAKQAADRALGEAEAYVPAEVERLQAWREMNWPSRLLINWRILGAKMIKSELWETLAIIAVSQLVVLPWIGCRFWTRFLVLFALGIAHALLSYWFNWDFLYGINGNWMSKAWMTGDDRGWDGGILGPLSWGMALMAGTLAHDLWARSGATGKTVGRLLLWGAAFMAVGYSMSCLTRLYDFSDSELAALRRRHQRQDAEKTWLANLIAGQQAEAQRLRSQLESATPADRDRLQAAIERTEGTILVFEDERRNFPDLDLAESPVEPPWERLHDRSVRDLLAEPPFVARPADNPRSDPPPWIEHRARNYWMLGKRMPNLSFMIFATGFEFALFGLFVAACDLGGLRVGLFRTFGTNPLAAYFIHGMACLLLAWALPPDAALAACVIGCGLAFAFTYVLVRFLELRGLYWRL